MSGRLPNPGSATVPRSGSEGRVPIEGVAGRVPIDGVPTLGRVAGRAKSTVPGRLPGVRPGVVRTGVDGRVPTDGRETPVEGLDTPVEGRDTLGRVAGRAAGRL
jgi:hypothetical protein